MVGLQWLLPEPGRQNLRRGSPIFGLGGLAITYLTAPLLDNYLRKIPYRISVPVCLILIGAFLADQSYSKRYPNEGAGITDYKGAYVENRTCKPMR